MPRLWKVTAFFGNSGLARFWCEEKINDLICQSNSTDFKLPGQTKLEATKSVVTENQNFQTWDGTLLVSLFRISEGQYSNARNKIDKISFENVSATEKLFIETMIKQMKPVVFGEIWGWVRIWEKLLKRGFYSKLRTIKILIQRTTSTVFNLKTPPKELWFRLKSSWKILIVWWLINTILKIEQNKWS